MARKCYSDEDVLKLLREIDVRLDVVSACRKAGVSDKSHYYWRNPAARGLNLGDTDHSAAFDAGAGNGTSIRAR